MVDHSVAALIVAPSGSVLRTSQGRVASRVPCGNLGKEQDVVALQACRNTHWVDMAGRMPEDTMESSPLSSCNSKNTVQSGAGRSFSGLGERSPELHWWLSEARQPLDTTGAKGLVRHRRVPSHHLLCLPPPRAITIGAVKPALSAMVAP
jgi:hypothetical protein